jgi:hypothetical protein
MERKRKPGGGRKRSKPEYRKEGNLAEQIERTVELYNSDCSLQTIADALNLNPIKVRKLLITAGVYKSDTAEMVQNIFAGFRQTQNYGDAVLSTAATLKLSKSSITSYLPYEKGVYFPSTAEGDRISVGAERQKRYKAVKRLLRGPNEETLWSCIVAFRGYTFHTLTGLPFSYTIKTGRNGTLTKELWIDRREGSKSLAWSSVLLAFRNVKEVGAIVERPKALGDIRGVSYIYGMFYRFGLIRMAEKKK